MPSSGAARRTGTGAGIGLFLGWFAMIVLAVVWIKTIWARTPYQLAAERGAIATVAPGTSSAGARLLYPRDPKPIGDQAALDADGFVIANRRDAGATDVLTRIKETRA